MSRFTPISRNRALLHNVCGDDGAINAFIGAQIQRRRKDLDLTQEDLGKMIHVSQDAISLYERGKRDLTAVRLWQISIALECKPWELWI